MIELAIAYAHLALWIVAGGVVLIALGVIAEWLGRRRECEQELAAAQVEIRDQARQIKDLRESLEQAGDALVFWAGWHDEAIARDHERLQRVHDARAFGEAE